MIIHQSEWLVNLSRNSDPQHGEIALVRNPSYVYPPEEYYLLAPRIQRVKELRAVLMDMDGTTTTTEELCLLSLENMIRRISGKPAPGQWSGLDHENDYPHIIGNSTTRHVEYLLQTYRAMINEGMMAEAWVDSAFWTLSKGHDARRKEEVLDHIRLLGLSQDAFPAKGEKAPGKPLVSEVLSRFDSMEESLFTAMAIDIYYENYHRMLGKAEGMISPMPGLMVLLPLLKGWLGEKASFLTSNLADSYHRSLSQSEKEDLGLMLKRLGLYFEKYPVKLALVTSSIRWEAQIVMKQLLGKLSRELLSCEALPADLAEALARRIQNTEQVYDAVVTADDSSEIRLKPHRDLYSIALHRLGLMPADFDKVIAFEDSESGTLAIRAAGIGCCIAVPFAQSSGHSLKAATHILKGGIPEALFPHGMFLDLP